MLRNAILRDNIATIVRNSVAEEITIVLAEYVGFEPWILTKARTGQPIGQPLVFPKNLGLGLVWYLYSFSDKAIQNRAKEAKIRKCVLLDFCMLANSWVGQNSGSIEM